MDGEGAAFPVSEERNWGCDPICALALACPHALYQRRTAGDRQQRGRTGAACRRSWTKELFVRGVRLRRRTCRCHVQPHRISKTEWTRSGALSSHCARPDRRPSRQPHRGTSALESGTLPSEPILTSRLDTLLRCPLKNKWTLRK